MLAPDQILLDLNSLPLGDVKVDKFCLLDDRICKVATAAPFIFIFMLEKVFFFLWVGFLLLLQSWQIAVNKTTNEMSNSYRLEYFMMDTSIPEGEETLEEHSHAHSHAHGIGSGNCKPRSRYRNPFDKGAIFNCAEFCTGASDSVYYELHQVPESTRKAPNAVSTETGSLKIPFLGRRGEHLV